MKKEVVWWLKDKSYHINFHTMSIAVHHFWMRLLPLALYGVKKEKIQWDSQFFLHVKLVALIWDSQLAKCFSMTMTHNHLTHTCFVIPLGSELLITNSFHSTNFETHITPTFSDLHFLTYTSPRVRLTRSAFSLKKVFFQKKNIYI